MKRLMEQSGDNSGSDKDAAMKKTFESFSFDEKKKGEKKKATPEKSQPPAKEETGDVTPPPKAEKKDAEEQEERPQSAVAEILSGDTEDNETKSERDAPLEKLSGEEKIDAAGAYVEAGITDTAQELVEAEPDSQAEAEAAAGLAFLEAVETRLEQDQEVNGEMLEQASNEALEALEMEPPEPEDVEAVPAMPEESESVSLEANEESEDTTPEAEQEEEEADNTPEADTEAAEAVDDVEEEDDDPNQPNTPPVPPPPVNPPNTTVHGAPGPGNPGGGAMFNNMGGPNVAGPNINVINVVNHTEVINHNRRRGRDLLLGGVVGYLIGRRRGRINTEKKLLPIQAKLEKQVKGLHETIAMQELKVRKMAAERYQARPELIPARREKLQETREKSEQKTKQESAGDREPKGSEKTPESEPRASKKEALEVMVDGKERLLAPKTAEQLTLPLLLEIAEGIKLGETSLRTMYEEGTLNQRQLREVIKKYLEGERLDRIWPDALEKQVEGKELAKEKGLDKLAGSGNQEARSEEAGASEQTDAVHRQLMTEAPRTDTLLPNSPVIQAILDHDDTNGPSSKKPWIALAVVLTIVAVIVISLLA